MWGSVIVYVGVALATIGLALIVKPARWLRVPTRVRALVVAVAGVVIGGIGLALPASESRVERAVTRLDAFAPIWQFSEIHSLEVDATPERVFAAVKQVRADEIALFRTLTWMRRAGRSGPENILNAGSREPLLDVATRSGFVTLAEEPSRELVIGTVVVAPPSARGGTLTPEVFQKPLAPGFALAAMNFLITPIGSGRSLLSTETRVFANSPGARRQFAPYWRVIYPGSAIIRRMWLRAIARRATGINVSVGGASAPPIGHLKRKNGRAAGAACP